MIKRRIVSIIEPLEVSEKSPHETLKFSANKAQKTKPQEKKFSIREKLELAKIEADRHNANRDSHTRKSHELER